MERNSTGQCNKMDIKTHCYGRVAGDRSGELSGLRWRRTGARLLRPGTTWFELANQRPRSAAFAPQTTPSPADARRRVIHGLQSATRFLTHAHVSALGYMVRWLIAHVTPHKPIAALPPRTRLRGQAFWLLLHQSTSAFGSVSDFPAEFRH